MSKRNTFNYNLKKRNKVVYIGITNNLDKRAGEHKLDGKDFDIIEKIGRAKTFNGASKSESKQLAIYRENHKGNNPKYNKTKNG
ncbi:MAG: GIY-YIG nuclease family protein [Bacteroidales bacterium]|nr:GIY-YIG nuclease family protein [Bacteroidales bacterium]